MLIEYGVRSTAAKSFRYGRMAWKPSGGLGIMMPEMGHTLIAYEARVSHLQEYAPSQEEPLDDGGAD
jgi:hypothetical protein